jgi:hypothetical protein
MVKSEIIGDQFHQIVIENKDEILKKFVEIKTFQTLDKIEDSIRLG